MNIADNHQRPLLGLEEFGEPLDNAAFTDLMKLPETLDDSSHIKKEGLPPLVSFRGKKMPRLRRFPSKDKSLKYQVPFPEDSIEDRLKTANSEEISKQIEGTKITVDTVTVKEDKYSDKLKHVRESLMTATEHDHGVILEEQLKPLIQNWCDEKEKQVNSKEITDLSPMVLDEFMRDWKRFEDMLTEHSKVVVNSKPKRTKTKDSHRCLIL